MAAKEAQTARVLLHEEVHAPRAGVGDGPAACMGRAERHRGVALDPEGLLLVGDDVGDLGVAQEGLGGNAPPVQADAAGPVVFHGGDREPELGAADRGDIAGRTGADDDYFE